MLLILLALLKLVFESISTNCTSRRCTETAQEATSSGARSPSSGSSTDESSSETAFAIRTELTCGTTLLRVAGGAVLAIVLLRIGLAVALLGLGVVARLLRLGSVLGLLLGVLWLRVLLLKMMLVMKMLEGYGRTNLLSIVRLGILLLLRVTTLGIVGVATVAVIVAVGHDDLCVIGVDLNRCIE